MATFKLFLGLGMTVVLLGIVRARLGFLHRVGASSSGTTTAATSEQ
jgi:hypothetical protein